MRFDADIISGIPSESALLAAGSAAVETEPFLSGRKIK
jgi:hypothetical protein